MKARTFFVKKVQPKNFLLGYVVWFAVWFELMSFEKQGTVANRPLRLSIKVPDHLRRTNEDIKL